MKSAITWQKRLVAVAVAAAIVFVLVGGLATMATPIDTLSRPSAPAAATAMLPMQAPIVATFTGTYVDGVPVYRLPPVTVTVSRKAELARIEGEERVATAPGAARSSP